jgi:SAM-dependent methyltransferase
MQKLDAGRPLIMDGAVHQRKGRKRGKSKDAAANDASESDLVFTGERIVPQADNCEPNFASRMYQEHIARYLFASQIATNKSVIDIGCGVGYGAQRLGELGAASVHAFDLSEDAIRHAHIHYAHPNVHYEVGNAESFTAEKQFDVAVCFELIEHVRNPRAVMKNIRTALVDDGILVMSTPRALEQKRTHFHEHEFSLEEYADLIREFFGEVEMYVENNHFSSLVTKACPAELQKIICLKDQFDPAIADVFIAVAGSSGPLPTLKPALSLDDDAYVTMLERDVEILHKAEKDLREKADAIEAMRVEEAAFRDDEIDRLTGEYKGLFNRFEKQEKKLWDAEQQTSERELKLASSTAEIERLTAECKTLRDAANDYSNKLRESEMKHAELQQEQNKLRKEIDLLAVRSADADARRLEAYEFARSASQAAHGLRLELEILKRDVADALDRPDVVDRAQESLYDERHREIVFAMEKLFLGTEATHHITRDPIVARIARVSAQLNAERARTSQLGREIQALQEFQREAEDWHRQLLRMRKSASWRMTAPLRWAGKPFRNTSKKD